MNLAFLLAIALADAVPLDSLEQQTSAKACADNWKRVPNAGCGGLYCLESALICTYAQNDPTGLSGFYRLGHCEKCEGTGDWVPESRARGFPDGFEDWVASVRA